MLGIEDSDAMAGAQGVESDIPVAAGGQFGGFDPEVHRWRLATGEGAGSAWMIALRPI
jgi:hypothetical protein